MTLKPPKHLSREARGLFRDLVTAYGIQDERGAHLLTLALEQLDRMRDAQRSIAAHGAVVLDRYKNPKANPALAIEARAQKMHIAVLSAALKGRKRVDAVTDRSRSASVVALHEFINERRTK